ncbi:MAG TPA: hypothetical protein VF395_16755 [Polyangiaceae bacterium]
MPAPFSLSGSEPAQVCVTGGDVAPGRSALEKGGLRGLTPARACVTLAPEQ